MIDCKSIMEHGAVTALHAAMRGKLHQISEHALYLSKDCPPSNTFSRIPEGVEKIGVLLQDIQALYNALPGQPSVEV